MASASKERWDFPDPNLPGRSGFPEVDDVTRMNATPVERVFHVRCAADIQKVIGLARAEGRQVSVRGTQHSMGAQSIARAGFVLDCRRLRALSFDAETGIVTTGPGNTWADLITHLNQFGISPKTMQSYATFSVGGSLSVYHLSPFPS